MPVFNEESTISEVIDKVLAVDLPVEKELIVVNDGSSDITGDIIDEHPSTKRNLIKVYNHEKNHGKGMAIRTGLKYVSGDMVIIQDADLELDPEEYKKLIAPILKDNAQIVYGSRFLNSPSKNIPLMTILVNKLLALTTNLLFGSHLTDEATSYKIFSTELLKSFNLKCIGFEFCPEVTGKALQRGMTIVEVPIKYNPRNNRPAKN